MRKITLEEGYVYIPNKNLLINQETFSKFKAHIENSKIELNKLNVDENFVEDQIKNLYQLLIGVTAECNLRCDYCVYNNNYEHESTFSSKILDFKTAKTGIEYIFNLIKDRYEKTFTISFYGGEPFIAFNLIREIVSYARNLFKGWKLVFGVTTNATRLSNEVIDYLIEEDFNIMVSLDGPQHIHDAKRKFQSGTGTFDTVWTTLERIKEKDNNFFESRISFNLVHSLDQSLSDIFNFYTNDSSVNKNKAYYNQVATKNSKYYDKIEYNAKNILEDFSNIIKTIKKKKHESKALSPIEKKIFENYILNDDFNIKPANLFAGTCFFNTRLYLDVNGEFHICESINSRFPIGDVLQGFNLQRMVEMLKEYEAVKMKHCTGCDVEYLCKPCYVIFAGDGKLEIDEEFCKNCKKGIILNLRRLILFEVEKKRISNKENLKTHKFHQFVEVIKGPVNTALVDLLTGNIYQESTQTVTHFENEKFEVIKEFVKEAEEAGLTISVDKYAWIPKQVYTKKKLEYFDTITSNDIALCIEEGANLPLVKKHVSNLNISRVVYYGTKKIDSLFPGIEIIYEEINMRKCSSFADIKIDDFIKADEEFFKVSQVCNNCWGHKISVTKDGKIRPCIYSTIVIDDIKNLPQYKTFEKIKQFWHLNKDKVKKCKKCELRYFCFDCREIAQRAGNGDLHAENPRCKYNPETGIWTQ